MKRLFIHIPKNGGMTIRDVNSHVRDQIVVATSDTLISKEYAFNLKQKMAPRSESSVGYQHARWRDVDSGLTAKYTAFAVIRNPWDKVVSRYTFRQNSSTDNITFVEFLDQRHTWGAEEFYWHRAIDGWYPQVDHVCDATGILQCDVLRFEHYNLDVVEYLALDGPLRIRNVSNGHKTHNKTKVGNKKAYSTFYTNRTIQVVADWYAKDIDFFGFDFDSTATKNTWSME